MKLVAPSILSADFSKLGEEITAAEEAGADWIHIDVMDGRFVPNITVGPIAVKAAKRSARVPLDVHLMVENPHIFLKDFAEAGADYISVHAEACTHLNGVVRTIKDMGVGAGVVLNPSTPIDALDWTMEYVDIVVVMSVNPGFGGQTFIESSLRKISAIKSMIDNRGLDALLEVDGGVKESNVGRISKAGADVFVTGSAFFGADDYKNVIKDFKDKM